MVLGQYSILAQVNVLECPLYSTGSYIYITPVVNEVVFLHLFGNRPTKSLSISTVLNTVRNKIPV